MLTLYIRISVHIAYNSYPQVCYIFQYIGHEYLQKYSLQKKNVKHVLLPLVARFGQKSRTQTSIHGCHIQRVVLKLTVLCVVDAPV